MIKWIVTDRKTGEELIMDHPGRGERNQAARDALQSVINNCSGLRYKRVLRDKRRAA